MSYPAVAGVRSRPTGARRVWLIVALVVAVLLLLGSMAATALWVGHQRGGHGSFPGASSDERGRVERRVDPDPRWGDLPERMHDWMHGERS